eukprot:358554-Chlamydomonas_euryale.AAC.9
MQVLKALGAKKASVSTPCTYCSSRKSPLQRPSQIELHMRRKFIELQRGPQVDQVGKLEVEAWRQLGWQPREPPRERHHKSLHAHDCCVRRTRTCSTQGCVCGITTLDGSASAS